MNNENRGNFDILDGVLLCTLDCLGNVSIPEGVIKIEDCAFLGIEDIKSLTLPESLKVIGERAFFGCSNLREISFSAGTLRIESSAFEGCTGLRSITLPRNLIILGENAFKGARSLSTVSISDELMLIENGAFADCPRLKTILYSESSSLWNMIEKGEKWDNGIGEYVVECSDSEIKSTSS